MNVGKELVLLFSVLFLPGMLGQSFGVDPASFDQIAYHVQVLAIALPQIVLVVSLSNLRIAGSAERFGWRKPDATDVIPLVVGFVACYATALLLGAIAGLVGAAEAVESTVDWRFTRIELVPVVLVSTLAIGYREEIFFRAYLASRAPEIGVEKRVLLYAGALVFGAGHLYQGLGGFLLATVLGVVFAEIYLRTDSLHGIAVAHGLFNFVTLLQSGVV